VEEYERLKQTLPPALFSMTYSGVFQRAAGLVYPDMTDCVVAVPREPPQGRLLGGLDFGYSDPCAAIVGVVDQDDVLWIIFERYVRQKTLAEHAPHLPPGVEWYADSARPDSVKDLRRLGFQIRPAKKKTIMEGIELVHRRLKAGKLRIVKDACPMLLMESSNYHYQDKDEQPYGDTPVGGDDHCLDALRYMITMLDRRKSLQV
jgi:phage terminase large subunit